MFLAHYAWRSFVYPLLQRGGKSTPVYIWLLAVAFCMYNGLLQVRAMLASKHLQHHIYATGQHCNCRGACIYNSTCELGF